MPRYESVQSVWLNVDDPIVTEFDCVFHVDEDVVSGMLVDHWTVSSFGKRPVTYFHNYPLAQLEDEVSDLPYIAERLALATRFQFQTHQFISNDPA